MTADQRTNPSPMTGPCSLLGVELLPGNDLPSDEEPSLRYQWLYCLLPPPQDELERLLHIAFHDVLLNGEAFAVVKDACGSVIQRPHNLLRRRPVQAGCVLWTGRFEQHDPLGFSSRRDLGRSQPCTSVGDDRPIVLHYVLYVTY